MKLLCLVIILLSTNLATAKDTAFNNKKNDSSYVGDHLKNIKFKNEKTNNKLFNKKNLIQRRLSGEPTKLSPHQLQLSALYHFYALSTQYQGNGFSSEVLSDFSPGFGLTYNYNFAEKIKLGFSSQYQRAIFQTADINILDEKTANTFLLGANLTYSLSSYLNLQFEAGYESSLFLTSLRTGTGNIETYESPYGVILLSPQIIKKYSKNNFKLSLDLAYKKNLSTSNSAFEFSSKESASIGLNLVKKINSSDYKISLHYSKAKTDINNEKQTFDTLALSLSLLFGGN